MISRLKTFAAVLLLLGIGTYSAVGQEAMGPDVLGSGFIGLNEKGHQEVASRALTINEPMRALMSTYRTNSRADEIEFDLPLEGEIDVDFILTGYLDHDRSTGIKDYMGEAHTYDGHAGTDIAIRNFREMDLGVPVYAAASGVVGATAYTHPDRNATWSPGLRAQVNGVVLGHGEDMATAYLHFRRNSVTVEVGEEVEKGQFLGYVGSSGFSDLPHLHFEVRTMDGENVVMLDPFEGPAHAGPSLWADQHRYVGNDVLKVYDIGLATRESMGGDLNAFYWAAFLEPLSQPAVFGANDQQHIVVWFLAQNQVNARYRLEIIKPDGSLYTSTEQTMNAKYRIGIWYFYWPVPQPMPEADYGMWQFRMLGDDGNGNLTEELYATSIEMGAETEWAPRFLPAGKSIRINGETQRDTLRMSAFTGDVSFHVLDQPSFVSIEQDSIVVFEGSSDQMSRSAYFQIVATDAHARTDTMWYHIVDPTKPLDAIGTSSEFVDQTLPDHVHLIGSYPNPFSSETSIDYTIPTEGHVQVQVFDILGREVATLVDEHQAAGRHSTRWDASSAPSGLYLYRIFAGGRAASGRMVLVR